MGFAQAKLVTLANNNFHHTNSHLENEIFQLFLKRRLKYGNNSMRKTAHAIFQLLRWGKNPIVFHRHNFLAFCSNSTTPDVLFVPGFFISRMGLLPAEPES